MIMVQLSSLRIIARVAVVRKGVQLSGKSKYPKCNKLLVIKKKTIPFLSADCQIRTGHFNDTCIILVAEITEVQFKKETLYGLSFTSIDASFNPPTY